MTVATVLGSVIGLAIGWLAARLAGDHGVLAALSCMIGLVYGALTARAYVTRHFAVAASRLTSGLLGCALVCLVIIVLRAITPLG